VAQEVMRAVAGAIRKFKYDPQRGRFRSWLLMVTRSKLNNFLARQQRQPVGMGHSTLANLLAPGDADLEKNWDRQYYQHLFDWAAEQVRPRIEKSTWQAFLLTTIEGQETQEVATRLGISVGAVYIAKCRTLARLKEVLMNVAEDEWESGMHQ
jgi:RNA polymerase sigma-70 factor (ECF subfamily)